jgi:hypothetical protein
LPHPFVACCLLVSDNCLSVEAGHLIAGETDLTPYDHVMVGANLALLAAQQRRYGWSIVTMSAVAAALPDWDGLTILSGGEAYARVHRVWGHNVAVASALGAAAGAVGYISYLLGWWGKIARLLPSASTVKPALASSRVFGLRDLATWSVFGITASLSHLAFDLVYSGHAALAPWPLALLWPFSPQTWVYPIVPYGDLGATAIFIVEMFVLCRRPSRATPIAWITMGLVLAYIGLRWQIGRVS